jgi:hypothetical protein
MGAARVEDDPQDKTGLSRRGAGRSVDRARGYFVRELRHRRHDSGPRPVGPYDRRRARSRQLAVLGSF